VAAGLPKSLHGVHAGKQTTFWLPPALKDRLRRHAADTGRTMTGVVVDALEREMAAGPESAAPASP
jgi:hypothetical protein